MTRAILDDMRTAWNKGLTKETSPILMKLAKQKSDWWKNNDTTETRKKIGISSKGRPGLRREKNAGWKGGRITSKRDGYVSVIAPDGHPYSKAGGGGNRNKYILEHRLVMEKLLGRYLLPDEDVNHINGIKGDNRPENLTIVRHYAHYHDMKCPKCNFTFRTR